MDPLTPDAFASRIIDACAGSDVVEDYDLQIHENVVVRSRIRLIHGFIDVYKNFQTDTTAYAWIADEARVFGADNTGGWHRHPYGRVAEHEPCEPVGIESFLEDVETIAAKQDLL